MNIEIRRALPEEADALTEIAIAAKRHWGYPERWIEIWMPSPTRRDFMRKWECTKLVKSKQKWTASRAPCQSWRFHCDQLL
ncbi:MAG: hypothetical protein M1485_06230 [Chloroflexi bacterium]|nr:hypothetical protein [Chloroflexota bacterium]MCL5612138.1 hypothetical protein [Chloroflexota bacterium]